MRKTPVESCILSKDADHDPAILLKDTCTKVFFVNFGTTNQQPGLSRIKWISRTPI